VPHEVERDAEKLPPIKKPEGVLAGLQSNAQKDQCEFSAPEILSDCINCAGAEEGVEKQHIY